MQEHAAILEAFRRHVSSGKAAFFESCGMPVVMGRREGIRFWNLDGSREFINLHCNGGVFNLGHRHPELIRVLVDSLTACDIGNHHLISAPRARLAEDLARRMPGELQVSVFGVGGGEAVDLAIKVARAATGRATILSTRGGYHGHTGLALATGDEKYRRPFGPQPEGFRQVPFGDLDALERALDASTAAVILETVPATLGMVVPPPGYLPGVRRLCSAHGALLILDEIQSGLGRTGRLWGFEHFDLVPDMVVLGKGLSGGLYPISVTVLRRDLEAVFHPDPFVHISTFGGAEPGCRVAQAVLALSSAPAFLEAVNARAELFRQGIGALLGRHGGFLKGFRQLGLMMGLELADGLCGPVLTKAAYDQGLLMIFAANDPSVSQLLPPLIITPAEVAEVLARLDRALEAAAGLRAQFP
jgi:acetylornithine/succinyldiaminopimelate/putrescine aminotransferase